MSVLAARPPWLITQAFAATWWCVLGVFSKF